MQCAYRVADGRVNAASGWRLARRSRGAKGDLLATRMHFPRFMRTVNRVFTNPLLGTVAWLVPPLAVVHHVGRKTGRQYRAPVVAIPGRRGGFVIPMTYGRDVDWARNIVRAGRCELARLGRSIPLRNPRIVGLAAAEPHLPGVVRPFFRATNFPGFVLLDDDAA
jgi:deazaflavin-dependent oxidoreductase (nitroreductase family)